MKKGRLVSCTALMISLLLTFSGCTVQSGASNEAGQGSLVASRSDSPAAEKPVTLKVMSFSVNPDGTGPMSNKVAKHIEKELGIIIDLIPTTEQDSQKQLPALIASNDLPDIFFIPETDTLKYIDMMHKGNQILPLDDYLEEHAPNMMADPLAQASISLKKSTLSPDGKLYAIGMQRGTFDSGLQPIVGQFIRWDIYKQLGYPEINDYDTDLLEVLAKMQALENKNAEGQKTYAVGAWFGDSQGWGDWHITYNLAYAEGYTCQTPGDRIIYSDIATNKIVESNAQKDKNSLFWRAVKWYNKANQMGILDPDSFTQKSDQYEDKVKNGRYLYVNPGWMIEGAHKYFDTTGQPEKGFAALPPMSDDTDKFTLYRYYIAGQFNYAISKNCKNPEKAMELLDWMSSYENARILYDGVEGDNWNTVDGKPTPTPEYLTIDRTSPDVQKTEGLDVFSKMVGYGYGTIEPKTGVAVDLYSSSQQALEKKLRPVHKDMLEHYNAGTMAGMYEALSPGGFTDQSLFNLGSLPDDLQAMDASLQAYEFKNLFKCILAKDDAEFEKLQNEYIAGLDAFNIDAIYEYWLKVGKQQEQELKPVFDLVAQAK